MQYVAPKTIDAAVKLLDEAQSGANPLVKILAGGTDLLVQLRSGMIEPNLVVDIKRIPGMSEISVEDGGFRIGAAVSGAQMSEHEGLCQTWPGVVEAVDLIGSTQVQGRCTMVGNLCNASPAADSVPALVAAGAVLRIVGPDGSRDVAVQDVPQGPGKTSLQANEIVESIYLATPPAKTGDAYLRFIPRTEMDIAVVGAGICLTLDDNGICNAARVSLGAVAATVLVVDDAATALIGTKVDDAALEKLAAACSKAAKPIDDKRGTVEFRKDVAGVLARRAAVIALKRAQKN